MKTLVAEGSRRSAERAARRDVRGVEDVETRFGELDRSAPNDGLGDHEEIRIDVDDDGLARFAKTMKIVAQAAAAGTEHHRAPEGAIACNGSNRVDGALVLARIAVAPRPITMQVIAILHHAARQPAARGGER